MRRPTRALARLAVLAILIAALAPAGGQAQSQGRESAAAVQYEGLAGIFVGSPRMFQMVKAGDRPYGPTFYPEIVESSAIVQVDEAAGTVTGKVVLAFRTLSNYGYHNGQTTYPGGTCTVVTRETSVLKSGTFNPTTRADVTGKRDYSYQRVVEGFQRTPGAFGSGNISDCAWDPFTIERNWQGRWDDANYPTGNDDPAFAGKKYLSLYGSDVYEFLGRAFRAQEVCPVGQRSAQQCLTTSLAFHQVSLGVPRDQLVEGHDTLVRVFVQNIGLQRITLDGRLRVHAPGGTIVELPPANAVLPVIAFKSEAEKMESTLNFLLPAAHALAVNRVGFKPAASLVPAGTPTEYGPVPLTFLKPRPTVRIGWGRVSFTPAGGPTLWPDAGAMADIWELAEAMYPARLELVRLPDRPWDRPGVPNNESATKAAQMEHMERLAAANKVDRIVDFMPAAPGQDTRSAGLFTLSGPSDENPDTGQRTLARVDSCQMGRGAYVFPEPNKRGSMKQEMAHELAHTFCLLHNTTDAKVTADEGTDTSLEADGVRFAATGRLVHYRTYAAGAAVARGTVPAIDFMTKINTFAANPPLQPADEHAWLSPFRWKQLRENVAAHLGHWTGRTIHKPQPRSALGALALDADRAPAAEAAWLVTGQVDPGGTARLSSVLSVDRTPDPASPLGTHCLHLIGATGQELHKTCADAAAWDSETGHAMPAVVAWVVPGLPGARRVELRRGAAVLATLQRAAAPLGVAIQQPTANAQWRGTQTVAWTASAEATPKRRYSVRYSHDGGQSWRVLGLDLTATSLAVDADRLPGGDAARVQVLASDGLDTATAEVGPLSVPKKAPVAAVLEPAPGAVLPLGPMVLLRGAAEDPDGVDDGGYAWSSDRAGALGTGPRLRVHALAEGQHRLTLTVTNRQGLTHRATRDVTVSVTADEGTTKLYLPFGLRTAPAP